MRSFHVFALGVLSAGLVLGCADDEDLGLGQSVPGTSGKGGAAGGAAGTAGAGAGGAAGKGGTGGGGTAGSGGAGKGGSSGSGGAGKGGAGGAGAGGAGAGGAGAGGAGKGGASGSGMGGASGAGAGGKGGAGNGGGGAGGAGQGGAGQGGAGQGGAGQGGAGQGGAGQGGAGQGGAGEGGGGAGGAGEGGGGQGGAGEGGGGSGGGPACDPAACPPPAGPCEVAACIADACALSPLPAGTLCETGNVCDGAGHCLECLPGSADCIGNVPRTCDANGTWQSGPACDVPTPVCNLGTCLAAQPSCDSLALTCGATLDGDCCASDVIPGGTFSRSYDGAAPYDDPQFVATVSDVRLDRYEVTVGRFRKFVDAVTAGWQPKLASGKHTHVNVGDGLVTEQGWGASDWDAEWLTLPVDKATWDQNLQNAVFINPTWTPDPGPNESRPINYLNWYEAYAFCIWDGGFLATEAEWNLAAAGGAEQRYFPWSSPPGSTTIDPTYASYYVDVASGCAADGDPACSVTDLVPVGSLPAGYGRWGTAELAGNVNEWTLDRYQATPVLPCVDCTTINSGNRIIRGGYYGNFPNELRSSYRDTASVTARYDYIGVRCARNP